MIKRETQQIIIKIIMIHTKIHKLFQNIDRLNGEEAIMLQKRRESEGKNFRPNGPKTQLDYFFL